MPGCVKTRLCPPLDPATAADLYAAFVRDTVRKAAQVVTTPTIFYADRANELRALLGEAGAHVNWVPQGEGNLGERMARVPAPCVIVGTDSPHLPVTILQQAVEELTTHDVVFGPAEDGGYYLIGLRQPLPTLFYGIAWSTDGVLAQTLARVEALDLTAARLPVWYDIDTSADLDRLRTDLAAVPPGSTDDCPNTRRYLEQL